MHVQLPAFFEEQLQTNRELRSAVDGIIAACEPWLEDSKLPFFPDYTDHGIDHLNQVLATASGLITDEAKHLVTPGDVAVLAIATVLHDAAMHIREAGFSSLLWNRNHPQTTDLFGTASWQDLWGEFLFAAKRWDDRKLCDVLGEASPGVPRAAVRDPFNNYSNLADSDKRLIGEFIRIYHARMAHEFALHGVPGPAGTFLDLESQLSADLRDIAGLVARSHGVCVRPCIDYLQERGYHKREYKGVHAVYLMVLLRVSDYLQIHADRAKFGAFRYKHIPSPASVLEWQAHHAITNITQTHDDPESLEVQASPPNAKVYLRIKEWLSGIQTELDSSWAVLGEVYGSQRELKKLGLILRRLRSNLDDEVSFAKRVRYIPKRIEFGIARAEILKLLVTPLYGDRPQIGVRELVQNAVDAVRELAFLSRKNRDLKSRPRIEQESDVEVWLDDPDSSGFAWLTISDRGIGMTEDIIRNYFLMLGASFRRSDQWRSLFESREETASPSTRFRSQVVRSGRFGIGALAAFLLGNEIHVETRHVDSSTGLRFSTRLDADPIEVTCDDTLKVGTSDLPPNHVPTVMRV